MISVITTSEEFDAVREDWNALALRLRLPSPFHTWEWNRTWWNHWGGGHQLNILVFKRGQQMLGIAQYYLRRDAGLSSLVPLGWEDYDRRVGLTEHLDLLFPEENRAELLALLSDWLQKGGPWSAILLPVRESEQLPQWYSRRIVKGELDDFFSRHLPATWDGFLAGLNKSMRDNAKYYPKLMVRHGHPYVFRVFDTPDMVSTWLPRVLELHRERAHAQTSVRHRDYFRFPRREAFIQQVAPLLAARQMFKIGVLEVRGEVVAAQMWMEADDVIFLHYSGYQPQWSEYSVALVNTIEILKNAIARGLTRVEFLRGRAHFKERWDVVERHEGHALVARHPLLMKAMLAVPASWRRRVRDLPLSQVLRRLAPGTIGFGRRRSSP